MQVLIKEQDIYGDGIAKEGTMPIFVEKALPNEVVDIDITFSKKNYKRAKITKIIKSSDKRIEVKCPYYNECGGCQLLHQEYIDTLNFKLNKVKNNLKKIANIDFDIKDIIYNERYNYRNKVTLHVKNNKIGLYKNKSNDLIEINNCLLVNNKINYIINNLNNYQLKNVEEITIRISEYNNETLLFIKYKSDIKKTISKMIKDRIANNIIIYNKEYKTVYGNDYITEKISDKLYQISVPSFFQINTKLAEKAYDIIKKEIKNSTILDLYCGTGSIGIYVSENAKKVIGIEEIASAIDNANKNKELNKTNNIEFILGKVEDNISSIKSAEVVILDPPRSGSDAKTLETILKLKPKKIIYMSCDSATLARDLKTLNCAYEIKDINVIDMFPNTYHVETIIILEKK